MSISGNVSKTAFSAAHGRAAEHRRSDRLIEDPLAQEFLKAAGIALDDDASMGGLTTLNGDIFALRSWFFDERLLAFAGRGGRQVVLLAVGLDARAFRLGWPADTKVFELDLPPLLRFKEEVLAGTRRTASCQRVVVPTDLAGDWSSALTAAGFDRSQPTAWLTEGVLQYLTSEQGDRLVARLTELSLPGSEDLTEHINGAVCNDTALLIAEHAARMNEAWRSHLDEPAEWLARFGWHTEDHDIQELAGVYGRPVPPIVKDGPKANGMVWGLAARKATDHTPSPSPG